MNNVVLNRPDGGYSSSSPIPNYREPHLIVNPKHIILKYYQIDRYTIAPVI